MPTRDGGLDVRFRVRNTGRAAGDEVAQIYLGEPAHPPAGVDFAVRTLAAYARVFLPPERSRIVRLHVPARQLQY